MKKVMTTIVAAVLMTISAQAQVQPKVLGENHAMIRVERQRVGEQGSGMQGKKYLLLPVQEKEENAHIAVLDGRNEMVKRLVVSNVSLYFNSFQQAKSFTAPVVRRSPWKVMSSSL